MKNAYLIVLGDNGNRHYTHMLERIKKIGQSSQLVDNVFVLLIEREDYLDNMELVRNYIAGDEFGYCLVVTIDSTFSCAWSLSKEKSELFSKIVKDKRNEEQ